MTIEREIDPSEGWEEQVGLRLRCTTAEAQALHRALRAMFRGRMSPLLPSRRGAYPFTILVPATQADLERRWGEALRLAGLAAPARAPAKASDGATPLPAEQPAAPPGGVRTGQRPPAPGASAAPSRRPAAGTRSMWEQRFREAVRVVRESEARPVSHAAAVMAVQAGDDTDGEEKEALLASLPPASRLRAQIARYARREQHESIVALCAQRRPEVMALPASELLVTQLLDAHQAEARRLGDASVTAAGRELALAFLPELERLQQADAVRERLRQADGDPQSQASEAPTTITERLAALIQVTPAERLVPLEALRAQYPSAGVVRIALADAYAALGDVDRALALYRSERAADDVVDRVAALLLSAGRPREALDALGRRGELTPRLAGLRGVALVALGEPVQGRPLLERAWDAGERRAEIALAYARVLAAAQDLERAAEPYQLAFEAIPNALTAEDCRVMAEIAAGAGYGLLSGEEEAEYLDRYVERAGRRLRERPDAEEVLRKRVELRRAAERPELLRESLADWLEYLGETGDLSGLDAAFKLLRNLRREGAISREEQFDLLESLERLTPDVPGLADLLALEYQSIAADELNESLRQGRPMSAYVADLRRALHFLSRDVADELAQTIEAERQALAGRSLAVPVQVVEESAAVSLAGVSLTIVGGHVATRREVERELREHHGLTDFLEVAPSSEDHMDRTKVRERVVDRDLVAVITGYTGHDLTNIVRDLQRAGDVSGRIIWPKCRGKSGVVREILAAREGQ
ncbi:MAG: hypothetical protein OHK0015_01490 [Chloroflexi bacterium OHK40]